MYSSYRNRTGSDQRIGSLWCQKLLSPLLASVPRYREGELRGASVLIEHSAHPGKDVASAIEVRYLERFLLYLYRQSNYRPSNPRAGKSLVW